MKQFFVYMLCSKRNGTLYTGVTSDLIKRVYDHKNNLADGFTKKYDVWYGMRLMALPRRQFKNLDANYWDSRPLVVFTTTLNLPDDASEEKRQAQEKYDRAAGRKLGDLARSRGLLAVEQHLWAEVAGMKGPLTEEAIPKTKQFTRDVLESLEG